MPMVENLDGFLSADEFASEATLSSVNVLAVVDTESELELDGMIVQAPSARLKTSDAAATRPGAQFVCDGITYAVRQVLRDPPDGAFTRLVLARV